MQEISGDFAALNGVIGFFTPLIVNLVTRASWPNWKKVGTALAVSAVIGTLTAFASGQYQGIDIPAAILLTFSVACTTYQSIWKSLGVTPVFGDATDAERAKIQDPTPPAASS